MNDIELIVFQIARTRVELGDSPWVARHFDADAMEDIRLRDWYGRVTWCIAGYDSSPVELYAIPEVRQFLASWRRIRPHWLFFGSLLNDNLKIMYVSLLSATTAVSSDEDRQCRVSYDRWELGKLLADDLEVADGIAERIGISPAQRLKRAQDVMAYFRFGKDGR